MPATEFATYLLPLLFPSFADLTCKVTVSFQWKLEPQACPLSMVARDGSADTHKRLFQIVRR